MSLCTLKKSHYLCSHSRKHHENGSTHSTWEHQNPEHSSFPTLSWRLLDMILLFLFPVKEAPSVHAIYNNNYYSFIPYKRTSLALHLMPCGRVIIFIPSRPCKGQVILPPSYPTLCALSQFSGPSIVTDLSWPSSFYTLSQVPTGYYYPLWPVPLVSSSK
jgi:hypothetical protein